MKPREEAPRFWGRCKWTERDRRELTLGWRCRLRHCHPTGHRRPSVVWLPFLAGLVHQRDSAPVSLFCPGPETDVEWMVPKRILLADWYTANPPSATVFLIAKSIVGKWLRSTNGKPLFSLFLTSCQRRHGIILHFLQLHHLFIHKRPRNIIVYQNSQLNKLRYMPPMARRKIIEKG